QARARGELLRRMRWRKSRRTRSTGSSTWSVSARRRGEDAGRNAVETAAGSLRDLRVAEVTKMDMKVEDGEVAAFRTRVALSFKYGAGGRTREGVAPQGVAMGPTATRGPIDPQRVFCVLANLGGHSWPEPKRVESLNNPICKANAARRANAALISGAIRTNSALPPWDRPSRRWRVRGKR